MLTLDTQTTTPVTLQNALNQRKLVQLEEGEIAVDRTIMLGNGATLRGCGPFTTFRRATGFKGYLISTAPGAADVTCEDFGINDAPAAADLFDPSVRCMALHYAGVTGGLIRDVVVRNTYRWGIAVAGGDHVTVERSQVFDARGCPMDPSRADKGGAGGHGILINGGRKHRVSRCHMEGNWRTGFYAIGATGWTVDHCTFHNNAPFPQSRHGIERGGQIAAAYGCTHFAIDHNTVTGGNETQGIEIDVTENGVPNAEASQFFEITGNNISGQGYTGIFLFGDPNADAMHRAAHARIDGNILTGNNRKGNGWYGSIFCATAITDFSITDNRIVDDAPNNPGIRCRNINIPSGGPCDRYTIGPNHITLANRPALKPITPTMSPQDKAYNAALACDDLLVAGGSRNIIQGVHFVNGQRVGV